MNSPPVVSDASPLIALHQIGQLNLLEQLFGGVLIPTAVAREVMPSVVLPAWIEERALSQATAPQTFNATLGAGESEAIGLAMETNARLVILDERAARRVAASLALPVIGTLGILLAAKQRKFLPAVWPCLEDLMHHDFRIAPTLYEQILVDAGED